MPRIRPRTLVLAGAATAALVVGGGFAANAAIRQDEPRPEPTVVASTKPPASTTPAPASPATVPTPTCSVAPVPAEPWESPTATRKPGQKPAQPVPSDALTAAPAEPPVTTPAPSPPRDWSQPAEPAPVPGDKLTAAPAAPSDEIVPCAEESPTESAAPVPVPAKPAESTHPVPAKPAESVRPGPMTTPAQTAAPAPELTVAPQPK